MAPTQSPSARPRKTSQNIGRARALCGGAPAPVGTDRGGARTLRQRQGMAERRHFHAGLTHGTLGQRAVEQARYGDGCFGI